MNAAIGINMGCTTGVATDFGNVGGWLDSSVGDTNGPYLIYVKDTDMNRPSPANLWLMLDDHPDSIGDSEFKVEMDTITDSGATWIDHASCLHNGAGGFSFCDGHAVIHQWRGPNWKTILRYQPQFNNNWLPTQVGAPDSVDLRWLGQHTSAMKDPEQSLGFSMVPD
jgi:prepilin-type processing-associated H-X9-DG protein